MLNLGDTLPLFEERNQDGKLISSKQFLGKKLIIFFYPKANTPGCTAEACDLSDHYTLLQNKGYELIGISADSVEKQKKFHEKYQFKFDLIADESKVICELFGVWQPKKFMGKEFLGIIRTTFIFDQRGVCIHKISKVKTKEAAKQILELEES